MAQDRDGAVVIGIGIDISKLKFDLALMRNGKLKHKSFPNTAAGHQALIVWLRQLDITDAHACMESTNVYGEALAKCLHDHGYTVSIVNPARAKGFAQSELSRTKTDKTDAGVIARFCAALRPAPWTPHPMDIRELRALVRRLEALTDMRQQEINRLQVAPLVVAETVQTRIDFLDRSIRETKQRIRDHIDNYPDLKHKKALFPRSRASVRPPSTLSYRSSRTSPDSATPSAWRHLSVWRRASVSPVRRCAGAPCSAKRAAASYARPSSCQPWWRCVTTRYWKR